jgi:hypothetical protein
MWEGYFMRPVQFSGSFTIDAVSYLREHNGPESAKEQCERIEAAVAPYLPQINDPDFPADFLITHGDYFIGRSGQMLIKHTSQGWDKAFKEQSNTNEELEVFIKRCVRMGPRVTPKRVNTKEEQAISEALMQKYAEPLK